MFQQRSILHVATCIADIPDGVLVNEYTSIKRGAAGDLSPTTLISEAFEHLKQKPVEIVGGFLLAMGVLYAIQGVFTVAIYALIFGGVLAMTALSEVIGPDAAGILALISGGFAYMIMLATIVVLQTYAMAVYQMFWMKIVRGQADKVQYARVLRRCAIPLAMSALLVTGATLLGSLALIIGAYIVMLGLMFTSTIIWDHGTSAVDAMKKSWEVMSGHKLQMFLLVLLLCVLNLVGMLMCGFGMLVTAPVSMGALATFYNRIAVAGNAYLRA